jgi:signal transduction histidine kinase
MPRKGDGRTGESLSVDIPMVVASLPINSTQRNAALAVAITLLTVVVVEAPFAGVQLTRVNVFIPVLQTVICAADLITAVLLFTQYPIERRPAILALACGYMASGSFAFLQTLAFPGAYAESGIIGHREDSAAWFFVWWQSTFPGGVVVYALLKDKSFALTASAKPGAIIGVSIACTLTMIAGLTWLATAGADFLPDLYSGSVTQQTLFARHINLFLWLWGATAFAVMFVRRSVILDLWLLVTLFAWMPNFLVAVFVTAVRFSAGWYTARLFALIASCTVLAVLFVEGLNLYARLASALRLLRRERANRLMSLEAATSAIAHEIRQPLSAIGLDAETADLLLRRNPLDLEEVRACVTSVIKSKDRVEEVIASVRALIRMESGQKKPLCVGDVAQEVLRLVQHELLVNAISVTSACEDGGATVSADHVQLQQVILNLIRNAIDAMGSTPPGKRLLRVATRLNGQSSILLSVKDSGPGIAAENRERMFDPFFTTKSSGMGLGLAISQTIIEEHGGVLRLGSTGPEGSVFEVMLPRASTTTSDA